MTDILQAAFDLIYEAEPLILYVVKTIVPMALILFAVGIIWGLTKHVLNY